LACPTCGGKLSPMPTSEDKPLFPTSVYAISKQNQEQYCLTVGRAYDIPTVALRYFNVYGARQALSNPYTGACAIFSGRLLNDQRPMIFEDGEQTRDFVHVSDIVQANLLAMEKDEANYNAFNIGTGRPISIREIARMLANNLGKNIEPEIVGKYREGDIRHCVADISQARKKLGYRPQMSLEDGIAQLIDWVSEQQAMNDSKAATAELEKHQLVR
jgi:dTDP-L-rhamnose 4-epimerase